MSNIIKSKTDLDVLRETVLSFDIDHFYKGYIESVIDYLIPKADGQNLIGYNVKEFGNMTGVFLPRNKSLIICVKRLHDWLEFNSSELGESLNVKDLKMFKAFFFLFVVTHEIEHSYQYLMGQGVVVAPSKTMALAYNGIFGLYEKSNAILPSPIAEMKRFISLLLYKHRENMYVLERNANVESLDLLCQLAEYMGNEELLKAFTYMKNTFMRIGYIDSPIGSFEETYRKILMYGKYQKMFEEPFLSEDEKARYGFAISEEKRKEILDLTKKRS